MSRSRLAYALVLVALAAPAARADWRSLSGTLPAQVTRVDYEISPDSKFVAWVTDADTDEQDELYIAAIAGGAPRKLNPPMAAPRHVNRDRFAFSPDGTEVLYLADKDVENRMELYRVPVGGGPSVKVSGPLVAGGNVQSFRASGSLVFYIADAETNDVFELYSVPLTGGTPVKLNGTLVAGGRVDHYDIDGLDDRIIYVADQDVNDQYEIFSVPTTGGTAVKLNPPLAAHASAYTFRIATPLRRRPFTVTASVVFMATPSGKDRDQLYSIPAGGGTPTQLNFNLLPAQRLYGFTVSPTGTRVAFIVSTKDINSSSYAFKGKIYSALVGGGGAVDVSELPDPYFGTDHLDFTRDGSRVVFLFQPNAASPVELLSATVAGGVETPLYVPGQDGPPPALVRLSGDGQWVAFQDVVGGDFRGIYTVPPGGGNVVSHGVGRLTEVMPDSGRLLFTREVDDDRHSDVFTTQIFGGDLRNLSGLDGAGYAFEATSTPDSSAIVFETQIETNGEYNYDLRVSDGLPAQGPTTTTLPGTTVTTTTTTLPCVTARCILEAVVHEPPCAPDPVPQKIVRKLERAVDAIEAMPGASVRKAKRSLRLTQRLLHAAAHWAAQSARGRKAKLAPVCAQAIGGATSRVVEGLQR